MPWPPRNRSICVTSRMQAPEYDAEGNAVAPEEEEVTGSGLVLLSTRQRRFMMALVPAVEAADESEDLRPCVVQYELALLPDEHVLQARAGLFLQ